MLYCVNIYFCKLILHYILFICYIHIRRKRGERRYFISFIYFFICITLFNLFTHMQCAIIAQREKEKKTKKKKKRKKNNYFFLGTLLNLFTHMQCAFPASKFWRFFFSYLTAALMFVTILT